MLMIAALLHVKKIEMKLGMNLLYGLKLLPRERGEGSDLNLSCRFSGGQPTERARRFFPYSGDHKFLGFSCPGSMVSIMNRGLHVLMVPNASRK
ncbi:MAG: hypothetical protein CO149_01055 [Nitrospirae bacterium CG_4_9_14_3_um_filter_51_5]|nr:MAG: hypothetical protein CO149_01055 [Nitrospirae bacterium CG_4_9_14_3_um_filter_51_5]